ncbi:MAG TPA: hypothetical protein V6D28_12940 [Leptolyngbyaceae cyanobacterium]
MSTAFPLKQNFLRQVSELVTQNTSLEAGFGLLLCLIWLMFLRFAIDIID